MNVAQAFVWNAGTYDFDVKGEIQAATTARMRTDAKYRGRVTRSSDEAPVMGVERRGRVYLVDTWLDRTPKQPVCSIRR
ncbi:MAG: hypothetical protein FD169_1993 [Bacillota bacterium]|nr:MAG: hypothetical protein FD169_1993 [Bacillota bacterium]